MTKPDSIQLTTEEIEDYIYRGDRLTDEQFIQQQCSAIRRKDGMCIRERNSNMLVRFANDIKAVVLARRLKKIKTTHGTI